MKFFTPLLAGSLVLNALALVFCARQPDRAPPFLRTFFASAPATDSRATAAARAAEASRRQAATRAAAAEAQLWSTLDSSDLPTLIAHLRAAGFPPAVIRAVANARIEARFATRMQALLSTIDETPFWRPAATSAAYNTKFGVERAAIYRERTRLLRELLGDDVIAAAAAADPTVEQRRQFGDLPKNKIDLIQRINDDYTDMLAQIRAGMQGVTLPEDREKIALLEREKRADLAALLTSAELEAYNLRNAPTAQRLRSAATLMDATEAEFRTIFVIQQQFDDRIYPPGGVYGAEMSRRRKEATDEMNAQIAATLGPARAADFVRAGDYEFRSLVELARRDNLPLAAASATWDLRASTARESVRIGDDPTLTLAQKHDALRDLATSASAQVATALGAASGPAYIKGADWLQAVANGSIVRIQNNGMSFQTLPTRDDPPKK